MSDWVVTLIGKLGYAGVAILMLLENVFPPIPSEIIMPLAGYHAEIGKMNFWLVVIAGSFGSLLGTYLWYLVGRALGEHRIRELVRRHGKWFTVSMEELDQANAWFGRHGGAAVFVCRMIPALRTVVSLPAGLCRMSHTRFLFYSSLGTFAWTFVLTYAGKLLGENYEMVEGYLGPVSWIVIGLSVVTYLWRLWKQSRREPA